MPLLADADAEVSWLADWEALTFLVSLSETVTEWISVVVSEPFMDVPRDMPRVADTEAPMLNDLDAFWDSDVPMVGVDSLPNSCFWPKLPVNELFLVTFLWPG